jgi:hypothetical protein
MQRSEWSVGLLKRRGKKTRLRQNSLYAVICFIKMQLLQQPSNIHLGRHEGAICSCNSEFRRPQRHEVNLVRLRSSRPAGREQFLERGTGPLAQYSFDTDLRLLLPTTTTRASPRLLFTRNSSCTTAPVISIATTPLPFSHALQPTSFLLVCSN